MSGKLFQPPAKIIQLLLIAEGHGTTPQSGNTWPVFVNAEPPNHLDFVAVSDTSPISQGRIQLDGLYQMHYGVQVKTVSQDTEDAYDKIQDIQEEFESTLRKTVMGGTGHLYQIQSINTESGPISLGRYDSEHVLFGYSLNVTFSVRVTLFPP